MNVCLTLLKPLQFQSKHRDVMLLAQRVRADLSSLTGILNDKITKTVIFKVV